MSGPSLSRWAIASFLAVGILVAVIPLLRPDPVAPRTAGDPRTASSHSLPLDEAPQDAGASEIPDGFGPPSPPPETPRATSILGRVLDPDGVPLPGALVRVHPADLRVRHPLADEDGKRDVREGDPLATATTASDGTFTVAILERMPPFIAPRVSPRDATAPDDEPPPAGGVSPAYLRGHPVRFAVWHPEYPEFLSEPWTLDPDDLPTIELRLSPGRAITGRLVDTTDRPRSGVEVRARRANSIGVARTDETGSFRIAGLAPGLHTIDIIEPDWQLAPQSEPAVEGDDAGTIVAIPPGRLRIEVRDAVSGHRTPEATVLVDWNHASPDQRLGSRIPANPQRRATPGSTLTLPAAHWGVTARTPWNTTSREAVEVLPDETTEVTLFVDRGSSITGRAVDADGAPLRGATIALGRVVDDRRVSTTAVVTDRDGRFRLDEAAPGTYQVVARHPDHLDLPAPPFELAPATALDLGDLVLQPAARLAGRFCLDHGGAPEWFQVSVELCESQEGPCAGASVHPAIDLDRERWSVGGLPEGAVRIAVRYIPDEENPGGEVLTWQSDVVTLRPGEPLDLDIFLPRHGN